jgi:hypothetical protein
MNTTNHTSPSGEELKPCPFCGGTDLFVERLDYTACFVQCDSSVGEHEACCMRGPVGMQDDDDEETPGNAAAIRAWNRRAALTAEKVAAEPVAIVRDNPDDIGTIIEATRPLEVGTQLYLAAPQQPAQSAEQDERAAFLSGRDVEELFLRWSEWTTELGEAISRKNIDGFVGDLRALLAAQPVSGGKS